MPVLVFLGSSVWELCGAQILDSAFKNDIAYNNLPCTTVLACDYWQKPSASPWVVSHSAVNLENRKYQNL
jgi:hypothetical protein